MTELEKMLAGEMHDITDPEVSRLNREARRKLEKLNATSWLDTVRYAEALTELIPDRAPSSVLITPFFCDYGFRIRLGEKVYINANCTFLDEGGITVGAHTLIGPDCKLYTPHSSDGCRRAAQTHRTGSGHRDRRRLLAGRRRRGLPGSKNRRPLHHRCRKCRHAGHPGRLAGRRQSGSRQTETPIIETNSESIPSDGKGKKSIFLYGLRVRSAQMARQMPCMRRMEYVCRGSGQPRRRKNRLPASHAPRHAPFP